MTHKLMHEHVGKHAKECIEARIAKRVAQVSKTSISTSHGAEKSVYQAHQHHRGVTHKWSHPINP